MQISGKIKNQKISNNFISDMNVNFHNKLTNNIISKLSKNSKRDLKDDQNIQINDDINFCDLSDCEKITKEINNIEKLNLLYEIKDKSDIKNEVYPQKITFNNLKFNYNKAKLSWNFYKLKIKKKENFNFNDINKLKINDSIFERLDNQMKTNMDYLEIKGRREIFKEILNKLEKIHVTSYFIPKKEHKNLIYRDILSEKETKKFSCKLNEIVYQQKSEKKKKKITDIYDFSDNSIDYSLFNMVKIILFV